MATSAEPPANRALGAALETWSNNITLCDSSAELLLELEGSSPDLLYLGLSHAEVKQQPLLRMLKRVRTRFKGPIILLSAAPDLVQRITAGGLSMVGIELALKPLRRQSLATQSSQLLAPDAELHPGTTEQTATLAGLRVLVAEDHQSIRELLRLLLSRHGAKVTAVADGQQALQACADDAGYDLLLIDLHMPRIDGLRVINRLRQQGDETPIICLTADVTTAERQALSWAGADTILLKPIDESALLRAICEHCQRVGLALPQPTPCKTPGQWSWARKPQPNCSSNCCKRWNFAARALCPGIPSNAKPRFTTCWAWRGYSGKECSMRWSGKLPMRPIR